MKYIKYFETIEEYQTWMSIEENAEEVYKSEEKMCVDGVNETIQTIKSSYEQLPEQEQLLTFVTFSNRGDSFCRTKL